MANLEPLGSGLVPHADRRRVIAAGLPARAWPDRRLAITAVDAETGRRIVFDADSGVELVDAATASGALPGLVELATIDGRRYADGGVHSLYNADLASGHDVVVVISPFPFDDYLKGKLDAEVGALGEAAVHVIVADRESLTAIGPDPLSPATARAALDAGEGQARRESAALRAVWR